MQLPRPPLNRALDDSREVPTDTADTGQGMRRRPFAMWPISIWVASFAAIALHGPTQQGYGLLVAAADADDGSTADLPKADPSTAWRTRMEGRMTGLEDDVRRLHGANEALHADNLALRELVQQQQQQRQQEEEQRQQQHRSTGPRDKGHDGDDLPAAQRAERRKT